MDVFNQPVLYHMPTCQLSASILSADFAQLGASCAEVLAAGIDRIHFDVMDNHFVPNLALNAATCKALRQYGITAPIDVHLMVQPVDNLIEPFARAEATSITCHIEAISDISTVLDHIQSLGCQRGLAINPPTDIHTILPYLSQVDHVLIMSVHPGFPGQKFITETLNTIQTVRKHIDDHGLTCQCAVDGGINLNNLSSVITAGADQIVMGSALFNSPDISDTLKQAHQLIEKP